MQDAYIEEQKDFREYLSFFARRRWPMILTALVVVIIAAAVAVLLPPAYRSTATILIEEQEIPPDLVRTTISSYADQRIQVISQQVMTRSNLMQIVEKYDLYPRQRKRETTEEILERMRKDIKLDLVTADVIDRRSGSKTSAAIAFTLSYDSENPEKAQKVANELVSLYLNENLKNRQQQVAETSTFLSEEADRISAHISEIEGRLASFKRKNMGRLPELSQLNLAIRDRTETELSDVERQLQSVEERRFYLDAQLAQIKPNSPIVSSTGERILDADERLRALNAQYAGMAGVYSEEHPDLIRMRREMEALRKEAGSDGDSAEAAQRLDKVRTDRAALREKYSDDHPDVARLDREIRSLEQSLAAIPAAEQSAPARKPENPTYITFQAQVDALNSEQKALQSKRRELLAKRTRYETRLEQTPQVEREYLDLSRDHENSVMRYREIKAKLMEAEVAQELEKGAKAERFSLIDPPQFPEKPRSPNRPAILLVGMVAALGGGVGYGGVLEGLDSSIKNPKQLTRTLQLPLLSVIPYIRNGTDRARGRNRRIAIAVAVLLGAVMLLGTIHFFWMPLEVFWYYLLRRLQLG
jgi:uncharacterized protein involved in exopolysaccharide biosynthesis